MPTTRSPVLEIDPVLDRETAPLFVQRVDGTLAEIAPQSGRGGADAEESGEAPGSAEAGRRGARGGNEKRLVLDLGAVVHFDSAGVGAILQSMRSAKDHGVEIRLRRVPQPMLDFLSLVRIDALVERATPRTEHVGFVTRIGAAALPLVDTLGRVASTTVDVARGILVDPFRGKRIRLDRTIHEIDQAANGALPIVALIAFLLGLILAMQAYVQLRLWGAEIYMADMVGVSVMTEIAPLMTAIVFAARSGSSNAAQLGSMVVGEEIDALRQMGVDANQYLVVPKVLALAFSVVALVVMFDVIAMAGGALFGFAVAAIDPEAYAEQTRIALKATDFFVALGKSLVFGLCIGVVGCGLGLRVSGGSEGVGRATTNAVVLSIFLIIIIDSVFVTLQRMVFA